MGQYTVYRHTSPSNKVYIGITKRKRVNDRWRGGNGYSTCPAFNAAIKKYGWENITHEILASGLTKEEAEEMERELIDKHKATDARYGYNILRFGNFGNCGELPESVIEKIRASSIGRKQTAESIEKTITSKIQSGQIKSVVCYETMERFRSASDAARSINISVGSFGNILGRPERTARGFHWCYEEDVEAFKPKQKRGVRPIVHLDTGVRYPKITDASKATGAPISGIILVCQGKQRRTNGMAFCYAEDFGLFVPQEKYKRKKPVRNVTLGKEYESAAEAAKDCGTSSCAILRVCKGERPHLYGEVWEFVFKEDASVNCGKRSKTIDRDGKKRPVVCLETGTKYESISEASRKTAISRRGIGNCCGGKMATSGGKHWKYADEV